MKYLFFLVFFSFMVSVVNAQSISQFNDQPIQNAPVIGDGSRFVGNGKTSIIAPPPSEVKEAQKLPSDIPQQVIPQEQLEAKEEKPVIK